MYFGMGGEKIPFKNKIILYLFIYNYYVIDLRKNLLFLKLKIYNNIIIMKNNLC
jgi:hypothetical protein